MYQDEPFFEMVTPGTHTIFIQDKNSCGIISLEISIRGFPKFFTPNNDEFNNTWQIQGLTNNYKVSHIFIYDRFGKLLTKIDPKSIG